MPGNKNTKTVKAGSPATQARKKPIKLSLADFHTLLDQKSTPENGKRSNGQQMKPTNDAEWPIWQGGGGNRGGGRGRGIFVGSSSIFTRNLAEPQHQNKVTEVPRNPKEPKQSIKPSKSIEKANGFGIVSKNPGDPQHHNNVTQVPKNPEEPRQSLKPTKSIEKANGFDIVSKNPGKATENGHSERSNVISKNQRSPKNPEKLNGILRIPENLGTTGNRKVSFPITVLKRPNLNHSTRGRPKTRVRSCPRIPTPPRDVPPELETVDRMTSADFRHDYGAHLENMRIRQKGQQHMQFFATAIQQNRHLFKGRSILVLCCGPGTLALMAAQVGARRVYAVDYSQVTGYAQLVVRENRMEKIIKVMHGRIADIKLPEKVDGIVCNWMGHCLLYESEVLEVLEARDRWLKKSGFILPDLGSLYLLGSEERMLKNDRCNWWLSVYGFNMTAMRQYALAEPRYAKTTGQHILTLAHRILSLDLNKAKKEDLFIDRRIRLQVNKDGYLECFLLYFDVEFSRSHIPAMMSCNPCLRLPYKSLWQQTVLFVEQAFVMRSTRHYMGNLKFRPLKPDSLKEMEIQIEFFGCDKFDDDLNGGYCDRLVTKRWLMLEHFQTPSEVASCQDERAENFQIY